jgi:hypothetical protein
MLWLSVRDDLLESQPWCPEMKGFRSEPDGTELRRVRSRTQPSPNGQQVFTLSGIYRESETVGVRVD